ncbi:class I SAM-dependent methyltransferase [Candidatus Nitrospira nitrificans]|uniref:Methyltransferase type 11 domain-containing protein n=1 Tax=Candidatus Nitrospira nitrificans TaxID=1742973 RepID=A0A0S4L9N2_9BACT|nr:methyltransferase domain-containing protein [Candidatus Nitrospira nitrificans]CUS34213.1 conserved hypothetical protein [Candidatus Nitrospira nitrificans]
MKPRALEFLVCPIDRTQLELVEWEATPSKLSVEEIGRVERLGLDLALFSREIVTGVLLNRNRKVFYPIYKGVPRLLTFPTGVADNFAKQYAERIGRELLGFTTPRQAATPGEETVLRTFSSEWVNYDWDGRSYWNLNAAELYDCMHFLLDLSRRPVKDKLVLEVGIGIGGIADYMAGKEECELIGMDLGHAVDPAYRHFGMNAFLHIVQASVFTPPFRESTFDLAYSQGVIHHTFSTKTAFDRLCKLPKPGGRLYIWVYNPASEQRTVIRRIIMLMERMFRPVCWRLPERLQTVALLPIIPLYLIHQNLYARRSVTGSIKYGWREALHAARDRFTPRFAHRHTEEEVCGWFREAGYVQLRCASKREYQELTGLSILANETAVDGVRT